MCKRKNFNDTHGSLEQVRFHQNLLTEHMSLQIIQENQRGKPTISY